MSTGPDWTRLGILLGLHGIGDAVVGRLDPDRPCPDDAGHDERRLYAALWLDRHRGRAVRLVAVRRACCVDQGTYPTVAGVYLVPSVGLVVEPAFDADAALPAGTRVLADAVELGFVCTECDTDLTISVADLLVAVQKYYVKNKAQRVDLRNAVR
jgi:hypothetical protein